MKTSTLLLLAGAGAIGVGVYYYKKKPAAPTAGGAPALPPPVAATPEYKLPEVQAVKLAKSDADLLMSGGGYGFGAFGYKQGANSTMTAIEISMLSPAAGQTIPAGQSAADVFKLLAQNGYTIVIPDYTLGGYQQGGTLANVPVRALKGADLLSAIRATTDKSVVLLTPDDVPALAVKSA
jgi:hypothetical protein